MSGFLTEVGVKKSNLTQTYSTTAAPKTQKIHHKHPSVCGGFVKGQMLAGVRIPDTDVLHGGVLLDSFETTFAAHSGLFYATKGAAALEMTPELTPTRPNSRPSETRKIREVSWVNT